MKLVSLATSQGLTIEPRLEKRRQLGASVNLWKQSIYFLLCGSSHVRLYYPNGDGAEAYLFQPDIKSRYFKVNQPLTSRHIWYLVIKHGKLAGLGKVSPHDLRRTAITQAFKHKSVQTLMIYNKNLDNLENNAVHNLDYMNSD